MGRLIQSPVALLGIALPAGLGVLLHLGPQPFVGGPDLAGDIAGHLRGQAKLRAYLVVVLSLQAFPITGLAVGEGILTDQFRASR